MKLSKHGVKLIKTGDDDSNIVFIEINPQNFYGVEVIGMGYMISLRIRQSEWTFEKDVAYKDEYPAIPAMISASIISLEKRQGGEE